MLLFYSSDPSLAAKEAASWRGQSLTEFNPDENESFGWQVVNDGVMGGLSKGNVGITKEGTMKFSGKLSLQNNGGFSTIRSGRVNLNLSNDLGLLLLVKGDGRTYEARLDSDARFRGNTVSFAGEFKTTKGKWQQVKIPFSAFKGSFRGTDLPDMVLDPSLVQGVGILLADKQAGPFDLEIDWIRTYGKGQGSFTERNTKPASGEGQPEVTTPSNLIATAVADGRFKTLKTALDTAGLTPFFQWANPLTVFAPTDEAFAKLPKDVLADLLKPENKQKLISLLSYHVSPGANGLADALKSKEIETIQGAPLKVAFSGGRVRVNDAVLVDGDVRCSDGVIHVIDTVLLPPEPKPQRKTVLSVAKEAGAFSTLLAAVEAVELEEVLEGEGPFTVFAPTDEAFASLPDGVVASLLKKENRADLVELLKYHVVAGRVSAGDALNAGKAATVQGEPVQFAIVGGILKVNESTIRTAGIEGGNGIIHIIDSVLLPQAAKKKLNLQCGDPSGTACSKKTSS
jgi:uncharacterized surface protein with fasciclin (FAS1) repeats